ncbi:ABC transporter permease [Clostridium sp. OS1-26]|uniref:ABC transporter permease n=1 Tax=Clostridium sp. OS1-26 TaxID=3070681 RepID=UPI0027DF4F7B|nr:ABC transporter permease [Clostridium sp. OS1-26]WML36771.1 ABC transporter permease [Clostridium sp. OS1-26]
MQKTKLFKNVLVYSALIILWQLIYVINVDVLSIWKPYNFPSPIEVIKSFYSLVIDNTMVTAFAVSMKRLLIGYSISLVIGTIIGFLLAHFKIIGESLNGIILGFQTLPSICWIPFSILWFGLDESSILFVIAVGSVFAIAMAIEAGIKSVNPLYLKAGKNMGADGIKLYRNVIIPAALPSIIQGMKQGWSFSWRGLMAGEMISASKGLGQVLMAGRELADVNQVTVIMLIIVIIGLCIDKLIFGRIEEKVRYIWGLK